MTEWRLNCYDGKVYTLPNPVAWRLDYGLGSPCDSFWVKALWSVGQEETLAAGTRMQVFHDGALCFVGVVDECEVRWQSRSRCLRRRGFRWGRGAAAGRCCMILPGTTAGRHHALPGQGNWRCTAGRIGRCYLWTGPAR